jgi:lipopolysaccharide export system protein LptA
MTAWQRKARFVVAAAAIAVAIAVALAFKRPSTATAPVIPVPAPDPKALVESEGSLTIRHNREKEEIRISYESASTYADGPTKMQGVTATTIRAGGRKFVLRGDHAELTQGETNISLVGNIRLEASDGMVARAERATYTDADAMVRAPGPIDFSRGRLSASGIGLNYAKNTDVLTILERAIVKIAADAAGAGTTEISSGSAEFSRIEHIMRFSGGMSVTRGGQTITADSGLARLSADDQRLESVELRGRSNITASQASAGALKELRGENGDLKYAADGQTLERAVVTGQAVAEISGGTGRGNRVISADTMDVGVGADGVTPVSLTARANVALTIPAEQGAPARSIEAQTLDSQGQPGRGLSRARFGGGVIFRERSSQSVRTGRSATLDASLAPGLSEIEDARFTGSVRFEEGALRASAADARYVLKGETLELRGSEPGLPTPQVIDNRLSVYATRIDVALSGPVVRASGAIKSELRPAAKDKAADGRMPSIFKDDQLVAATAGELTYDGHLSSATYSENAQLWQGDTSIKAAKIVLDEQSGDLTAEGSVVTAITLEQEGKDKRRERVQTTASSKALHYEESSRRATYIDDAHVNGPQGDMTAVKVELFLKESGNELERVEAYDTMTLRDQNRETRGSRMTYFAADERYLVTGTPVVIKDECARETTGGRVTFNRRSDTIVVDGNEFRTATRGGANCP